MGSEGIIEKYINPYTDFGFKKLFGTKLNKDLLISFLNSLLQGKEVVKDVQYLNTENLGTAEYDRRAVFDVYCENEQGEKFLVEMQRGEQQFFKDRSVFYTTFPIREQAKKGRYWNYELKAVYMIGILNFIYDKEHEKQYQHEIRLYDFSTKSLFYDKLTIIFLEIPKFTKGEDELETMMEKWMFVLRNLGRLDDRPLALQERVFLKLFKAAEIAGFKPSERVLYEDSLKAYRDWFSTMETQWLKGQKSGRAKGRVEGLAEGLEKGREEGRKEERMILARQLRKMGFSSEQIIQAIGLTPEDAQSALK